MNSVVNLKSTKWRKLFKILKSSSMESLNIFRAREDFLFEFTSLSGVWKFENYLTGQDHMSVARFRLTARDGCPVPCAAPIPGGCAHRAESARRRWPLVVAAHVGWSPLTTAPDITKEAIAHFAFPSHCFTHRCPLPMSHPELSDQAKRSASSPRPSCTESLPTAPVSEAGPRDFPHPTDPAATSAPQKSSSSTTSLATSTTPLAPHLRPLPVIVRTAAEASSPVSTPFSASPPRFSCSSM
jgi:hypothetical protein